MKKDRSNGRNDSEILGAQPLGFALVALMPLQRFPCCFVGSSGGIHWFKRRWQARGKGLIQLPDRNKKRTYGCGGVTTISIGFVFLIGGVIVPAIRPGRWM